MSRLDFSSRPANEGGKKTFVNIEGVLYTNILVDNAGLTLEHGLGREPYIVLFTPKGAGLVYLSDKNRTKITIMSNTTTGVLCDVLIF